MFHTPHNSCPQFWLGFLEPAGKLNVCTWPFSFWPNGYSSLEELYVLSYDETPSGLHVRSTCVANPIGLGIGKWPMVTLLGGRVSVYLGSSTFSFVLFWVDETLTLSRVVIVWWSRPCLFATFGDPTSRTCSSLKLLFCRHPLPCLRWACGLTCCLVESGCCIVRFCCCHRREYVYS